MLGNASTQQKERQVALSSRIIQQFSVPICIFCEITGLSSGVIKRRILDKTFSLGDDYVDSGGKILFREGIQFIRGRVLR